MQAVLAVHSYYIGRDVDWSKVEQQCVNFLLRNSVIALRADVRRQRLRITPTTHNVSFGSYLREKLGIDALDFFVAHDGTVVSSKADYAARLR